LSLKHINTRFNFISVFLYCCNCTSEQETHQEMRYVPHVTFFLFTTTSYTYYKIQKKKKNKQLSSR